MTRNTHPASFLLTVAAMLVASLAFAGERLERPDGVGGRSEASSRRILRLESRQHVRSCAGSGRKGVRTQEGAATTVFDAVYDARSS